IPRIAGSQRDDQAIERNHRGLAQPFDLVDVFDVRLHDQAGVGVAFGRTVVVMMAEGGRAMERNPRSSPKKRLCRFHKNSPALKRTSEKMKTNYDELEATKSEKCAARQKSTPSGISTSWVMVLVFPIRTLSPTPVQSGCPAVTESEGV